MKRLCIDVICSSWKLTRLMIALTLTLLVFTLLLFPLVDPDSGSYIISIVNIGLLTLFLCGLLAAHRFCPDDHRHPDG